MFVNWLQGSVLILLISTIAFSCTREENPNTKQQPNYVEYEGMVFIPGGSFNMGGNDDESSPDEYPLHPVEVSSFYMDQTEVTNQQFEKFIKATGYVTMAERAIDWEELKQQLPPGTPKPPDSVLAPGSLIFKPTDGPVPLSDYSQWWEWTVGASWKKPEGPGSNLEGIENHPVVHIAYEDALAYAEWVGKRLPTEAEWEYAARGGTDNKYPWGNNPIEQSFDKANFWQGFFPFKNDEKDGFFGTAPVKSFPPNAYGLYDMAGNVWEWCQDRYNSKSYADMKEQGLVSNPRGAKISYDPLEPLNKDKYVVRGGSFLCNDSYCSGYRVSRRMPADRNTSFNHTGFRCVKDEK